MLSRSIDNTAPIRLAPLSKAIIRFYSQCREIIIEETSMRIANPQDREIQLGLYINALLILLDIVIVDFVNTGYINTMQDLIVVAIASSTLRLVRCLANAQPEIKSTIISKLSQGPCCSCVSIAGLTQPQSSYDSLSGSSQSRSIFSRSLPQSLQRSIAW